MNHCTLAIDQGSHASRALLFDAQGKEIARCESEVGSDRRDGGIVEQDLVEILESTRWVIARVMADARQSGVEVAAAGLATQRSTLAVWDAATGEPAIPALHWQDTRFADDPFISQLDGARIRGLTGLPPSAHYGAPRIHALLQQHPNLQELARQGRLRCGPVAAFLIQGLLRNTPFLIDESNATRMLTFDLWQRRWSPELLAMFELQAEWLPQCRPVESDYGVLAESGVALKAVAGDQNAVLYANGEPPDEAVCVNVGSGAFVLAACGSIPPESNALLAGIARSDDAGAEYVLEGTVNAAASALHWAGAQLGCAIDLQALNDRAGFEAELPVFINRLAGLGSPWWQAAGDSLWLDAGGAPVTPEPQAALLAVLESIVFKISANLLWLRRARPRIRRLRISGGLSSSDFLCQRLADVAGLPVQRMDQPQASARGIAWLAAGRPKSWPAARSRWFEPGIDAGLLQRYSLFLQTVESSPS